MLILVKLKFKAVKFELDSYIFCEFAMNLNLSLFKFKILNSSYRYDS